MWWSIGLVAPLDLLVRIGILVKGLGIADNFLWIKNHYSRIYRPGNVPTGSMRVAL